jgi:hypothetical protein
VAKGNTLGSSGSHQGKIGFFLPRRRLPLHAYRLPKLSDGGLPAQLKSNERRASATYSATYKSLANVAKRCYKDAQIVLRGEARQYSMQHFQVGFATREGIAP